MIKHYNPLMRVSILSLFLLTTLIVSSCKKDLFRGSMAEGAKDWYINSTKTQGIIISENNLERKITKKVDWDKSKTVKLSDGRSFVTAPVAVEYSNGTKAAGSFMLIITGSPGNYSSMVVYDDKNNYFNGNLSDLNLASIHKNAEIQHEARTEAKLLQDKKRKNNIELQDAPLPECLDYYWVEILYDTEGNIIDYDEWFLFTACPTPEGTGGGGNYQEEIVDIGQPSSESMGVSVTQSIVGQDTFAVATLNWKYHDALLWAATSTERGAVLKKNGNRSWDSITHISNGDQGGWTLGTIEVSGTPTFTAFLASSQYASVTVDYQLRFQVGVSAGTYTIGLSPWKTKNLWSAKTWNTNFSTAYEE